MSRREPSSGGSLPGERTALAWDRTGVAFVLVGVLLLRAGGAPYLELRHMPGAAAIVLGAVLAFGTVRRRRADVEPTTRRLLRLRLVGAAAVGVSASALVGVMLAG